MKLLEVNFRDTMDYGYYVIGLFDPSRSIESQIVDLAKKTLNDRDRDGPYPRELNERSITYHIFEKE